MRVDRQTDCLKDDTQAVSTKKYLPTNYDEAELGIYHYSFHELPFC